MTWPSPCSIVIYITSELLAQTISFRLSSSSGVPAYLQIVQQVEQALRIGVLKVGDQLPTVKEVVAEVAVNPNTVLKAYRELEVAGLSKAAKVLALLRWADPQGRLLVRSSARRQPGSLG